MRAVYDENSLRITLKDEQMVHCISISQSIDHLVFRIEGACIFVLPSCTDTELRHSTDLSIEYAVLIADGVHILSWDPINWFHGCASFELPSIPLHHLPLLADPESNQVTSTARILGTIVPLSTVLDLYVSIQEFLH